jgi:hypothetical protein
MRIGQLWFMLTCSLAACVEPIDGGASASGSGSPTANDPGAGSGSGSAAAADAPTAYDQEILQVVTGYKGSTFSKINSAPYGSTLGAFQINVYAYGDVTGYRAIHPETTTTTTMGVGTVIVREVLDATGAVSKLTVIAKAPAGYDSTLGDWWFAQTDATGNAMVTNGTMQVGKLADCHSCHIPRASEDFLFGVPAANMGRSH